MYVFNNKFNEGDYIINEYCGDMAIIKGITPKGYYTFKAYYDTMSKSLKDLKKYNYELQVNYDKAFRLCTEDEKKTLDEMIK